MFTSFLSFFSSQSVDAAASATQIENNKSREGKQKETKAISTALAAIGQRSSSISIWQKRWDYNSFCKAMGYLDKQSIARCERTCKVWKQMIQKNQNVWKTQCLLYEALPRTLSGTPTNVANYKQHLLKEPSIAFGKKQWSKYFGDIGKVPQLPSTIHKILKNPCPFFRNKRVEETHMLVLVPATLNGTPMTLKRLGKLMKGLKCSHPASGYADNCNFPYDGNTSFEATHWILMTNDVISESRNKPYLDQKSLVEKISNYHVPELSDAIVAIFMEYVSTGIHRFALGNPSTFTRCQGTHLCSQMVVGGFDSDGLSVIRSSCDKVILLGVAAVWKFF